MENQPFLTSLLRQEDQSAQMEAIEQLSFYAGEEVVFDALCDLGLETSNPKVRDRVINALRPYAERAGRRYARAAIEADSLRRQRWALVNLSLLGCRSDRAKAAVLDGLSHPDLGVQQAAALSIGLFNDAAFLKVVERYMEKNRLYFIKESLRFAASKLTASLESIQRFQGREKSTKVKHFRRRVGIDAS